MRSSVPASVLVGVDAVPVIVEVHVGRGLPSFEIVGLAERALKEARVRVRAALQATGLDLPRRATIVNLAPAELKKSGAGLDLAIAVAILTAAGTLPHAAVASTLFLGELGLDGELRATRGVLPHLVGARERGITRAIVPAANALEASLAREIEVFAAANLREVVDLLEGNLVLPRVSSTCLDEARARVSIEPHEDLSDVHGQPLARRALEIAAAGRHALLFVGPPGAGKTMLARRLRGVLPPPDEHELLEIARVQSAAGLAGAFDALARPFRAPHHTATAAALVGGGDPVRPGELTLAHGGVLFLDELPEFRRDAVESLRVTMESGVAVIARATGRVTMPAAPLIVAAMNPCPCGHATDSVVACRCAPDRVERYRARVSGPLLDRFDLHVIVPRVPVTAILGRTAAEPSEVVRARVIESRARAARRCLGARSGADTAFDALSWPAKRLLERAVRDAHLSARAAAKVVRIARTIADLADRAEIDDACVGEALQYRCLDATTKSRAVA